MFSEYGNGGSAICDDSEDKEGCSSYDTKSTYLDQSRRQVKRAAKSIKNAINFLNDE